MPTSINILTYILEDDEELHEVIKDFLKENKISLSPGDITHDPNIFISKINQKDVNICVIDHFLSNHMTGLKVCEEVKKKNKWTYVIVMTGQMNYKVVVQYIAQKVDAYVDKNNVGYLNDLVTEIKKGFQEAADRVKFMKLLEATADKL